MPASARPDAVSRGRARLAWTGVALLGALIWVLGGSNFDAGTTSRFLGPLLHWLWPDALPEQREALLFWIRKLAHPVEYAAFAASAFGAARVSGLTLGRGAALGGALAIGLATADETRQGFTAGRTGSAADVALDGAGALLGLGLGMAAAASRKDPPHPLEET